ncbi:MAG: PD-(D/E)XK nuclease family protein [Saprospiraceae bacterium]|nr:PD-(D/E)XK nuclease family protein [Saprospiraceae bacterium]
MKKIVFGLQLDNKVPPIGMGEDNIEYFCGPQQLTILLEKRFGIKPPDDQQVAIRTDVYRQHLSSHLSEHPDAFYRHSFSADPFATAQTLLNLRDALKQAGWKGADNEDAPPRIRTLSLIEDDLNKNKFWPKGWTDRQLDILEKIPFKVIRQLVIYLVEPFDLLPVYWQQVLSGLKNNGAQIQQISSEPAASEDSDLSQFQRFIHTLPSGDTPKLKAKGDGSLCLFTGKRDTELAGWLAKWLNENQSWEPILLLPDKTRTLDNALILEGLPSLGLQTRSDARPALQLLKLVPEFLWQPLDPVKLLAFLTLPQQPIPWDLSKILASNLASKPGLFGQDWQMDLNKFKESVSPEIWEDRKKEYDFWFTRKRYSQKDLVPKSDLLELFTQVNNWSQAVLSDHESSMSISSQTQILINLIDNLPETHLSHLDIVRIIRTALEPIARSPVQAQKNHIRVTHHATAILEPIDDLIWWTFTEREPDYFFAKWYVHELYYLQGKGVLPDLPMKDNQRLSWYRKQAFLKTKKRLFLFLPERVEGAEIQPFPLFGDLNACFDNLDALKISLDFHLSSEYPDFPILAAFNLPNLQSIIPAPPTAVPLFLHIDTLLELPERKDESFTSLESLFYYPYKYVFQYKLGLYKAKSLEIIGEKRLYGNLAHRLFEQLIKDTDFWYREEIIIQQWIEESLPVLFEQEGATMLQYGKEPERSVLSRKLTQGVLKFVKIMKNDGWEPDSVETKLTGTFCDKPVSGIVDIILKRGNDRAIIDLKWSGKNYRMDLLKNKEDLQLALYYSLLHQTGSFDNVYTAFYIIESGELLSRNMRIANEGISNFSIEDPKGTYAEILSKMSSTFHWRKEQLSRAQIEIRNGKNSAFLEEEYGSLLELLEMKREDSIFDDFKALVNLPD